MGYTPKDWRNATTHEGGGDETTPISSVALEDLETRVTDHANIRGPSTSVMDSEYGVAADGVTNDTTGFGSARDDAGAGGHIYVPPGTYVIKNLDLSVADQRWEFAPGAVLKYPTNGGDGTIVTITGDGVTILGGEFDGNLANQASPSGSSGMLQIQASQVLIRDVYVHDTQFYGIYGVLVTGESDITIDHCRLDNSSDKGIFLNCTGTAATSRGFRISNCYVDQTSSTGNATGYSVYGATAFPIEGVTIANCYVTAPTTDTGGIEPRLIDGCAISGCTIEGCEYGITCGEAANDLAISGCTIRGAGTTPLELADSEGISVSGNVIDGDSISTLCGIILTSGGGVGPGCHNVSITGNSIYDLDTVNVPCFRVQNTQHSKIAFTGNRVAGRGVELVADCTDLTITGNFFGAVIAAGTAGQAIVVDDITTGSKRWVIRGNTLFDYSGSGAIQLAGSAGTKTISDVAIRGNTFMDCTGVFQISTATVVFDNSCIVEDLGVGLTDTAAATTTTLPWGSDVITITGTGDIESITASYPGRSVTLVFAGDKATNGVVDGSNLKLEGTFAYSVNDTLSLVCDGTNWYETGRSVN